MKVEIDREEDGRWIAEIPGVIVYGNTRNQAIARAEALALRVLRRHFSSRFISTQLARLRLFIS
jgi:hypothetical protein